MKGMRKKEKALISIILSLTMIASVFLSFPSNEAKAATKDAFGLELDTTIKNKDELLENNPYGTTGWSTLVSGDELFMAKGFENTRKFETFNYNEGAEEGTIGDAVSSSALLDGKEEGNSDGFKMMDTAAIDPKGEGQKRYVATMGYWRNKSERYFQLFLSDKGGNRISNVVKISNKDQLNYLNELDAHQVNGYVSIAAGDFDGDGKDSLIVYVPEGKSGNPYIKEFNINSSGSSFSIVEADTVVSNVYDVIGCKHLTDPHDGRDVPVVQMTVADTDRDSVDELVITAGIPDTKASGIPQRDSKMMIWDKVKEIEEASSGDKVTPAKVTISWKKTYVCNTSSYNGGDKDDRRLRFASSAVGNVLVANSGVDYPEIVTCGWVDKHDGNGTNCTDRIGSYLTTCIDVDKNTLQGSYTSSPVSGFKTEEFTREGHFEGDHVQSLVPVSVFNADGSTQPASVFIADSVYTYGNGSWTKQYMHEDFTDDDDGIGGSIISNNIVQDVTSGNFTCNPDGREEVIFSKMQKQKSLNRYWYTIYTYRKEGTEWKCSKSGYVVSRKCTAYLSLCTFDCDSDSIIAKVKDVVKTYTDPEVLTILESTPYFKEVNEGDIGNSQTAYGKMDGKGSSETDSHGLTTEVIAGFEWNVDDICAGFACGAGFEASIENNFTWETEKETSISYELEYSNDSGENMVIVCRRPVWAYEYEVKNSDSTLILSKQGKLVTSMITVDEYNEAAANYDLDPISEGSLCTPGNPLSYRSSTNGLKDAWVSGDWSQYQGGGTTTQTLSEETSTSKTFETEHSFSFSVYGILFGVKGGAGAGYTYTQSDTTITTSGITKTGAVNCIKEEGYDFNWQFANWKITLNDTDIPVLGYIISDVVCPPSPPENLASDDITTNTAVLTWEEGERPSDVYNIYQVYQDGSSVQIAEVDGTETEYKLVNLLPDTAYTYYITGTGVSGDVKRESVRSEEHTLTTLPEGLGSVDVVSPKSASVRIGENATFDSSITVNSQYYKATNYQWQKRNKGGSWENIPNAKASKLSLSNLTMEENNTEYRCIFLVSYSNATSLVRYYSNAALLTVGEVGVDASLTISGHDNSGQGTIAVPYKGLSDSQRQTGTTKTQVETTKNIVIPANGDVPKLTLYKDASNSLYGIGSNEDGDAAYYKVSKSGNNYTVGQEITEKYVQNYYEFSKTQTDESQWPRVEMDQETYEQYVYNGYALVAQITGETVGSDTLFTNNISNINYYWEKDGNYYTFVSEKKVGSRVDTASVGNPFDVYGNPLKVGETILGRNESWTPTGSTTIEGDYLFLQVKDSISMDESGLPKTNYKLKYMKQLDGSYKYYTGEYKTDFDPATLEILSVVENVEMEVPVYETKAGTKLTLSTVVKEVTNGKTVPSLIIDFKVTNTQTGSTETLVATTDKDGKASTDWVAPSNGLYKVEVVSRKQAGYLSATSDAQYYEASKVYDKNTVEYQLILSDETGKLSGSIVYGNSVNLQLQSREVTVDKEGNNTYGDWQDVNADNIRYSVKDSTDEIKNKTYTPDSAGNLVFEAYENASTNPLAQASLQVTRKNVTVTPVFDGIPTKDEDVSIVANDSYLNSLSKESPFYLKNVLNVKCGYFADSTKSGRYDVTLSYKTEAPDNAVAKFKANYNVSFESDTFTVFKDSVNIEYEAGENGSVNGKYSDNRYPFASGVAKVAGTLVEFDAIPDSGHQVDSWTINDKTYSVSEGLTDAQKKELADAGIVISNSNKKLTISSLSATHAVKGILSVKVDFVSTTKIVTYGVGTEGGSIDAVEATGHQISSGTKIEKGTDITFTASPEEGYIVDYWVINNERYTWPENTETYRGTEITISDIQENVTATVYFKESYTTYKLVPKVVDENGKENAVLADIVVTNAQDGSEITNLDALAEKASVTLTATVTNPTNNMVKEWQTSEDGTNFTTIKGSGGQAEITLYNISSDLYVRAVITAADYHKVSYEVHCGDEIITDESIAKIEAKCKKDVIENDSTVAALIPIDFTVTINDDYYFASWSDNVVADENDPQKASLEALTKDIKVIVNILEKPQVTITGAAGGTITVKGTYAGEEKTFAVLENKNGEEVTNHFDPNTDITATYEPMAGYVVDDTAADGAVFTDGDGSTTDNKEKLYTDNTEDFSIGGTFKALEKVKVTYSTEINTGDQANGQITSSADRKGMDAYHIETLVSGKEVVKSSDVTFTATPEDGYRVKEWIVNGEVVKKDGMTEIGNVICQSNVTEDLVVSVSFEHVGQEVVVESGEHGAIASAMAAGADQMENLSGGLFLNEGTKLTLSAKADAGYEIESWEVNGQKVEKDGEVVKDENFVYTTEKVGAIIRVHFTPISYSVTLDGVNATVSADGTEDKVISVQGGKEISVTAEPNQGYVMDYWTINGEKVMDGEEALTATNLKWTVPEGVAECEYKIEAHAKTKAVKVEFEQPENGTLKATANGKELVSGSEVEADTEVTFTVALANGYLLDAWNVNDEEVDSKENTYKLTVKGDSYVGVRLIPDHYTVSFLAEGEGTVNGQKEGNASVEYGKDITLTAAPNTYYQMKKWVDADGKEITNGVSEDGLSLTLKDVKEDTSVKAIFVEAIRYPVSYSVTHDDTISDKETFGTVTGKIIGTAQQEEVLVEGKSTNGIGGSKVEFTAKPAEGFMIDSWEVNGKMQACKLNTFTIDSLAKSTVVTANFTKLVAYQIPKEGSYNNDNLLENQEANVCYTLSERVLDPELSNVPEDQIREDGTVTYLVTPSKGKRITNISVISLDEELKPFSIPEADQNVLTKEEKEDGSVLVTISNINTNIALDIDTVNFYKLTIETPAKGSLIVKDSAGNMLKNGALLDEGTVIDYSIVIPQGWKFEGWSGSVSGTETSATLTITQDTTIAAKVISLWREVTIIPSTKGTITVTDEAGNVIQSGTQVIKGTKLYCNASAAKYYNFKSWTGNAKGDTASIVHVVEENVLVAAEFEKTNSAGINAGLSAKANNTICKINWGYVADADGYDIYTSRCGKAIDLTKPAKTIMNKTILTANFKSIGGQKLSKIDCYKVQVRAFKMVNGVKTYTEKSFAFHIANKKHKKYTNVKKIKLAKTSIALQTGKSYKTKVTLVKSSKKKYLESAHRALLAYYSSDTTVATVDATGKVTAVAPGTCKIYVISISGITKSMNVTVK